MGICFVLVLYVCICLLLNLSFLLVLDIFFFIGSLFLLSHQIADMYTNQASVQNTGGDDDEEDDDAL